MTNSLNNFPRTIVVKVDVSSSNVANIIFQALQPEIKAVHNSESVHINVKDSIITLHFIAKRTATLRALINSYLRWIIMIRNIITGLKLSAQPS